MSSSRRKAVLSRELQRGEWGWGSRGVRAGGGAEGAGPEGRGQRTGPEGRGQRGGGRSRGRGVIPGLLPPTHPLVPLSSVLAPSTHLPFLPQTFLSSLPQTGQACPSAAPRLLLVPHAFTHLPSRSPGPMGVLSSSPLTLPQLLDSTPSSPAALTAPEAFCGLPLTLQAPSVLGPHSCRTFLWPQHPITSAPPPTCHPGLLTAASIITAMPIPGKEDGAWTTLLKPLAPQ